MDKNRGAAMDVLNQEITDRYALYNADCVDVMRTMPDNSIDFSVYSPPFESLYVFSNSERDMGNSASSSDFWQHYRFLIQDMFRAMKPGRLIAIHCMNLPTSKARDGFIGIKDFRGEIIRTHQEMGFIYHSEVCIWKDPVTAMQRTKALGLLYKQLRKDSSMSRQGIADYLVVMRKPGENPDPVTKTHEGFPVDKWQEYASPVWMDVRQTRVLQYMSARESDDERHISPLQLDVIERAIELWTNPNDLVFTPFLGIGSEAYVALQMGRRAAGSELKKSYFDLAVKNCRDAVNSDQGSLFEAA
jgi:hypothetical protein